MKSHHRLYPEETRPLQKSVLLVNRQLISHAYDPKSRSWRDTLFTSLEDGDTRDQVVRLCRIMSITCTMETGLAILSTREAFKHLQEHVLYRPK